MFEAVELGRKISKTEYQTLLPELRASLLQAQSLLRQAPFSVVILLSGVEGAGRGELLNRLTQWIDMRDVEVHAFDRISDEELSRPEYWRYWRTLPPHGRMAIYLNSWYTDPLLDRALDKKKRSVFERRIQRIAQFERMLADDGTLLLKFWLHLSKKEQGKRLKKLAEDERTRWRVTPERCRQHKAYAEVVRAAETAIRLTDTSVTPWFLVEADHARYRDTFVARKIAKELLSRTDHRPSVATGEALDAAKEADDRLATDERTVLDCVDLSQQLPDDAYHDELAEVQERVGELTRRAHEEGVSMVLAFEGWDAAGKGGAIRRLSAAIDARYTRTIATSAPSPQEKAHHYLWRFWRDIPRPGHVTIYDRSWYGRVLVERVEGFAEAHDTEEGPAVCVLVAGATPRPEAFLTRVRVVRETFCHSPKRSGPFT